VCLIGYVLVLDKPFQSRIMFPGKARTYQSGVLSGDFLFNRLLALQANIGNDIQNGEHLSEFN
jgi:hypothetical protein